MMLHAMYCPRDDEPIECEVVSDAHNGDRIDACRRGDCRVLACSHSGRCLRLVEERPLIELLWPSRMLARAANG